MMPRSILTEKLGRRGLHLSREYGVDPLETISVADVMTEIKDAATLEALPEVMAYTDEMCRSVAEEMATTGVMQMPVVDRKTGRIRGMVSAEEVLGGRRRAVEREQERKRMFPAAR
jgi:CBS domain containing-hemolysin-like protein